MSDIYVVFIALLIAAAIYIAARVETSRFLEKLGVDLGALFSGVSALLAATVFLAIISLSYNVYALFVLILILFIFAVAGLLISMRDILSEYFAGLFIANVHGLRVGDFLRIGDVAGYIIAMRSTSLIIRDRKRDLVHVPYSRLIRGSFKVVRIEEGHEVLVPIFVPLGADLEEIKRGLKSAADEAGLEEFRVDVMRIGARGVVLATRGLLRDPRREEEVKYLLLDRAYSLIFKQS
nr:MAG: portal protein [Thermoproteus sp. AZ2]